jgi:hypothetical protein
MQFAYCSVLVFIVLHQNYFFLFVVLITVVANGSIVACRRFEKNNDFSSFRNTFPVNVNK